MTLSGIRALITRPEPQAQKLAKAVASQNGCSWCLPMLAIEPLPETQVMRDIVLSLELYDRIIVTSRPSAHYGCELIDQYWPQLPLYTRWYALAEGTSRELKNYGINAVTPETGFNSEALLELPELQQLDQEKCLIIKGSGGRSLIEETLKNRDARVTTLEVYHRLRPEYSADRLAKILERHRINVILCGSAETVSNLSHYLPASERAKQLLIVPGERVARHALAQGFQSVYCANGADNSAMISALTNLASIVNSPEDSS